MKTLMKTLRTNLYGATSTVRPRGKTLLFKNWIDDGIVMLKNLGLSNYFNCNTDNILHFHVEFQQHSVAFIRLLPQYYNR